MSRTHCEHCYLMGHNATQCPDRRQLGPAYRESRRRLLATSWALANALKEFNLADRLDIVHGGLMQAQEDLRHTDVAHQIVKRFASEIRDGVELELSIEARRRNEETERQLQLAERKNRKAAPVLKLVRR